MFPVVHVIQLAMAMRRRQVRRAGEEEPARGRHRKIVLLRLPVPFANDEQAGIHIPSHIHGGTWRGSETEQITNSGRPYPGT